MNRIIAAGARSVDLQIRAKNHECEFQRYQLSQLAAAMRILSGDSQILQTLFRMRERQPARKRIHIPNPDNYLDAESISDTNSTQPGTNSETVSNDFPQEPAQ